MTRFLILLLFLILCPLLDPHSAFAAMPSEDSQPMPTYCNDVKELSGILMVEGGAQPTRDIIRMAQIIRAESGQRGISICALTRVTNFIAVRHYAEAHPGGWADRNLNNPPEWIIDLAGSVLRGEYEDITEGMGHFDGDGLHIIFSP